MAFSPCFRVAAVVLILLGAVVVAGCADPMYGLSRMEQRQVKQWLKAGHEIVQEKSPRTATALGFCAGFGSFYTDNHLWGVVDLLTWPISVLWEPWIAPAVANRINYEATMDAVGD